MTKDEALLLAFEALLEWKDEAPYAWGKKDDDAIAAIKLALKITEEKYVYGTPYLNLFNKDKT